MRTTSELGVGSAGLRGNRQAAGAALGGPRDAFGLAVADGAAQRALGAGPGREPAPDREAVARPLELAVLVDLAARDDVDEVAVLLHLARGAGQLQLRADREDLAHGAVERPVLEHLEPDRAVQALCGLRSGAVVVAGPRRGGTGHGGHQ